METIHYIGSITYISRITSDRYKKKSDIIKAHIDYINKNAVYKEGNENFIISTANKLDKRINSRVAVKTVIALPNDISDYQKWTKHIKQLLMQTFKVADEKYIYVVIHSEHKLQKELKTKNLHAHIVFNPVSSTGKTIDIKKKELQELHKNWDKILEEQGYSIKKETESIGKIGWKLRKDKELLENYKNYIQAKEEQKRIQKELEEEKINLEKKKKEIESILLGKHLGEAIGIVRRLLKEEQDNELRIYLQKLLNEFNEKAIQIIKQKQQQTTSKEKDSKEKEKEQGIGREKIVQDRQPIVRQPEPNIRQPEKREKREEPVVRQPEPKPKQMDLPKLDFGERVKRFLRLRHLSTDEIWELMSSIEEQENNEKISKILANLYNYALKKEMKNQKEIKEIKEDIKEIKETEERKEEKKEKRKDWDWKAPGL